MLNWEDSKILAQRGLLKTTELTSSEKLFMLLVFHEGVTTGTTAYLAETLGLNETTILEIIDRLEAKDLIHVQVVQKIRYIVPSGYAKHQYFRRII